MNPSRLQTNWDPRYWLKLGWNKVAPMHATSVIDTVGVDMTIIGANQPKLVPIGGIAHAGAHGIAKVEVRVRINVIDAAPGDISW